MSYDITSYRMSYHVMSYHVISYHVMSRHIISYNVICYIISYYIVSYRNISYHIIYHIISSHLISYIMSCHVIYFIKYKLPLTSTQRHYNQNDVRTQGTDNLSFHSFPFCVAHFLKRNGSARIHTISLFILISQEKKASK